MTKQAQLTKMIHVYTDLLNSISGLFTAMMDSHLNHLMIYLNSVALISGIWGMNIGGLPGRTNKNGFWIIITIAAILTIIWAIILKKKKYND